jgi:hypothetical protein
MKKKDNIINKIVNENNKHITTNEIKILIFSSLQTVATVIGESSDVEAATNEGTCNITCTNRNKRK